MVRTFPPLSHRSCAAATPSDAGECGVADGASGGGTSRRSGGSNDSSPSKPEVLQIHGDDDGMHLPVLVTVRGTDSPRTGGPHDERSSSSSCAYDWSDGSPSGLPRRDDEAELTTRSLGGCAHPSADVRCGSDDARRDPDGEGVGLGWLAGGSGSDSSDPFDDVAAEEWAVGPSMNLGEPAAHICTGTGLAAARLCARTGLAPCHICTGTGLAPV